MKREKVPISSLAIRPPCQRTMARAAEAAMPVTALKTPLSLAASMGFIKGITANETRRLMRDQLNAPSLPESHTTEDDRRRDARDARLADRFNRRFETVSLNSYAEECLL